MKRNSLVFLITLLIIFSSGCSRSNDLVFLIPEGYTGWVHAVGDIPGKKPLVEEDGKVLVPIGKDGELRTCTTLDGPGSIEFYFVDSEGKRTKAHLEDETIDWTPKKDVIYVQGFVSRAWADEKGESPAMQQFFVGTVDQYKESLREGEDFPEDVPPINPFKPNACE